jgi:signal peptidase I
MPKARLLKVLGSATVGALCGLLVGIGRVTSTSMSPTIRPQSYIAVLHFSRLERVWPSVATWAVNRGDIVILQRPDRTQLVLKRVVALGGDRVRLKEGVLFLNGVAIVEHYVEHQTAIARELDDWPKGGSDREVVIPQGMVFVLGDNRSASMDSRSWGPVPLADVRASLILAMP